MNGKNTSLERQRAIQDLIGKECVSDQKVLVQLLRERYGIETNQAAVSRDLRKLGITKKEKNGELVYELPNIDTAVEILKLAIVDIQYNEVMIVVKTQPGLADFVGDYIDHEDEMEILGCLAGENVVFVVPKSITRICDTYTTLCTKTQFKK